MKSHFFENKFIIIVLFITVTITNNISGNTYEIKKAEIYLGSNIVGISENECSINFQKFLKHNYGNYKIETDDALLIDNIFFIKNSINLKSQNQIKNKCIDIALILNYKKSKRKDTLLLNLLDNWVFINNDAYLDSNKVILNSIINHLPIPILRNLNKTCNCK